MKIAKLFIKGIREPMELTEAQGRDAQQIKNGEGKFSNLADRDTVSIGDRWTGEKGDIRYVIFESVRDSGGSDKIIYPEDELHDLAEELSPFFIKEGDDEYKEIVEAYVEVVKDTESRIFATGFVVKSLEAIRNRRDNFDLIDNWSGKNRMKQGGTESDSMFNGRVLKEYEEEKRLSFIEKLYEDTDSIRMEVEALVKERRVGTLTRNGELNYLASKGIVTLTDGGTLHSLCIYKGPEGYAETLNKLSQYKDMVSRKQFASDKTLEGYEDMVGEVVNNMQM